MLLVTFAIAVSAPAPDLDAVMRPKLEAADRAIAGSRPAEALAIIEPVIAAYKAEYEQETRQIYCGMTSPETLLYMTMAANERKGALAVGPGYCQSIYLRGFALVDLGRVAEARASYEQAVALAPMHSHFLVELGQTYRLTKEWGRMLDTCSRATGGAAMVRDLSDRKREQGFALRCQGYALIEMGKLDEAEKLYRECLSIDPADAKAEHELKYIAEQRAKPSA